MKQLMVFDMPDDLYEFNLATQAPGVVQTMRDLLLDLKRIEDCGDDPKQREWAGSLRMWIYQDLRENDVTIIID